MARVRTITVNGCDYRWFVKSPKNSSSVTGRILVVSEPIGNDEFKDHEIFLQTKNIGPGVVKQKIRRHIGAKPNGEPIQQRRPKISTSPPVLSDGQAASGDLPSSGSDPDTYSNLAGERREQFSGA